ncbi:MAG: flap endonuclease-1 [Candidatus Nanoarchaeia archaeon]|nr:flap endonuclease-1 [Candidatus Nanoarchaeia archaeon]MDD5054014.1 flap endonuclease-1 [Candidatus Nanoarchaeia archaeon]MDD5499811.1 flap endonuclease-1 [Candidatus Nanoarchaeia archaeon]
MAPYNNLMGVNLKGLLEPKKIELKDLKGKKVAIDAFNALYQFISIIRQYDGSPLVDSKGSITSHLSGLFYRNINLLKEGILPCYVFDGKAPSFKSQTVNERINIRSRAKEEYEQALAEGDYERAKSKSMQSAVLTKEMVSESKELLDALGIPWIDAPSEGEAQAAFMAINGDVYASVSQDFDSLLFGTPILVRNLNITGKRKIPGKTAYSTIYPEIIILKDELKRLGLSREQLIMVAMLVGTDYNPKGVLGLGPKKAYKLVSEKKSFKEVFSSVEWEFEISPKEIFDFFMNTPFKKDYEIKHADIDEKKLIEMLCTKHDFSKARVESVLASMDELKKPKTQTGLDNFF